MLLTRLHPEIRRRIAAAPEVIAKKLWREDMRRWDEEIKPDSIARNSKLQKTPVAALGDADVPRAPRGGQGQRGRDDLPAPHLHDCRASFPLATSCRKCSAGPACPRARCSACSRAPRRSRAASAPRRSNACGPRSPPAASPRPASAGARRSRSWTICRSTDGSRASRCRRISTRSATALVSGYDIADKYALEMPEMLVGAIFGAADTIGSRTETSRGAVTRCARRCPQAHRAEFDELLEEARFIHRLRDERGMYNDCWGTGLARRAVLEAGRRLEERGVLPDAVARDQRQPRGDRRPAQRREAAERRGAAPARRPGAKPRRWPTRRRFSGRSRKDRRPSNGCRRRRRPTRGRWTRSIREIFNVPTQKAPPKSVAGLPVHPGVYEGPARIINGPQDFNRLQQGDVLVTRNTGPAFNVVLPLLGAIVTDRGGQLSHAAIVAREYGIPAVVGTREATTMFADGARVRVNGDTGRGRARGGADGEALAARRRARRSALRRQGRIARALAARGAPGPARVCARHDARRGGVRRPRRDAVTHLRAEFTALAGPVRRALVGHRRGLGRRELRRPARDRSSTCATKTRWSTPSSRCGSPRTPSRPAPTGARSAWTRRRASASSCSA